MPKQKRHKTDYPGVYYIETKDEQRIYYIWYYKDGKQIEEKAGHSKKDNMTAGVRTDFKDQMARKSPGENDGEETGEPVVTAD